MPTVQSFVDEEREAKLILAVDALNVTRRGVFDDIFPDPVEDMPTHVMFHAIYFVDQLFIFDEGP